MEERLREEDQEGKGEEKVEGEGEMAEKNGVQSKGPFRFERFGIREAHQQSVCERTPRQWFKACGPKTSPAPGVPPATHFAGLAYISDSWFIGTIARVYGLFGEAVATSSSTPSLVQKQHRDSSSGDDSAGRITAATPAPQLGMMLSSITPYTSIIRLQHASMNGCTVKCHPLVRVRSWTRHATDLER